MRIGRLLLLLLAGARACAATATCSDAAAGAGRADWNNPAIWSPAPPRPGDDLVLPAHCHLLRAEDAQAYGSLTLQGDASIEGATLVLAGPLQISGGTLHLDCPLQLAADLAVNLAPAAGCLFGGRIDLGAHGLQIAGEGHAIIRGEVAGSGPIICAGPGRVDFTSASASWSGGAEIRGGEAWVGAPVPSGKPGAMGLGGRVVIDGGALVLDSEPFQRPVTILGHGGRLDAAGRPRVLDGDLEVDSLEPGGLDGIYCNRSLRALAQDDWHGRPEVTGSRHDAKVYFPQSAFGTPQEQRAFRITGTPDNWDDFSVQWDGYLRVEKDGTRLSTCSDDGSRVWLQGGGGNGSLACGVWGSNGWGGGQGATTRQVLGPLPAGIYRIRIQFEDGGGPNAMILLWDDGEHADGSFAGLWVVPGRDLMTGMRCELGGEDYGEGRGQVLSITGKIGGSGLVSKIGSSRLLLAGEVADLTRIQVEGGTLELARPLAGSGSGAEVEIDQKGSLVLDQGGTLRSLAGSGLLTIAGRDLVLENAAVLSFGGEIAGPGMLRKRGEALATVSGSVTAPVRAEQGELRLGDGRVLAGMHLQGPLNSQLELPIDVRGPRQVLVHFTVPPGAPAELGWNISAGDAHGHWCQVTAPQLLHAGGQDVTIRLADDDQLRAEPLGMSWQALLDTAPRTVITLWSPVRSKARVEVSAQVQALERTPALAHIKDLEAPVPVATGERAEWHVMPVPFPSNPYDPEIFSEDATITAPDGSTIQVPGFFWQDMRSRDLGVREDVQPTGREAFVVRLRPRLPGTYRIHLRCRWSGGDACEADLPPLQVSGRPWDGYVRVDAGDHRFFSADGGLVWPIGLNIRSVNDTRSQGLLGTQLTPDRGTLSYDAYLERLAAAGGTAAEIWMAPWNLGLEWRADWNGFYGQGRYNQANAWRLDHLLANAERLGMHINLVILNHGQASEGADHEWENSPYNRVNGGRLGSAHEYFVDPWALRGQEAYRRYIIARFSDSPAILGWKLWSEVNLTLAGDAVVAWHAHASERWHALDPYHHPITTHWAGDWHAANPGIAVLPHMDYLCVDAYQSGRLLTDLITEGSAPTALGRFNKPALVTECGGNWNACPAPEMIAEQASAPWGSLVSGTAGSAMLWWYEFVDQHGLWRPYGAISAFLRGEDLRDSQAVSLPLVGDPLLWCRAWAKPRRMFGYCLDRSWGSTGAEARLFSGLQVCVGEIPAGHCTVAWWDADLGVPLLHLDLAHPGGNLMLLIPDFHRHIAFKLQHP